MPDRIYVTYTPTTAPVTCHATIHYEPTDSRPERAALPGIFSGKPMSMSPVARPLGGLADHYDGSGNGALFDFLAGLTRQNPMHPESPLVDEQEQADMQALDARFSSSGNIRDAVALYNARTSNRH